MLSSSSASPTGMKAASCHPLLPWHMMSRLGSSCPLPSQVRLLQPLLWSPIHAGTCVGSATSCLQRRERSTRCTAQIRATRAHCPAVRCHAAGAGFIFAPGESLLEVPFGEWCAKACASVLRPCAVLLCCAQAGAAAMILPEPCADLEACSHCRP